jgi:DASH complex subunit DAD2
MTDNPATAKLANPTTSGIDEDYDESTNAPDLPQTLVRIPTEHAPALQAQADAAEAAAEEERSRLST